MKRIITFFILTMGMALSLCGCGLRTVDEMYAIPRRSWEYKNLQSVIDAGLAGLEYAAPTAGENQQTIQMADLDGDGLDEIIVYTKSTSDKQLFILVFAENGQDQYALSEKIACNGTSFEQVEYVDMDGQPGMEIVVGRRLSNQIMAIASVYSFASGSSDQIISTIYTKFLTVDMDSDGQSDLFVIRNGEGERSNASVMVYSFKNGMLERSREVELSETQENIRRITQSRLQSGERSVFVASAVDESAILTDVFAFRDGVLRNLANTAETGKSVQTLRNYYLYSDDVDSDGIMELPSLVTMKNVVMGATDNQQYLIRWYAMDIDSNEYEKLITFHNYAGGWYIQLERGWASRIAMEQTGNVCTFYMWDEEYREAMPVFSVLALAGKDRDAQATAMNRFALHRGENVVYAGSLGIAAGLYGITEEYLTENFHLIYQAWKTGET